MHEVTVDAAKCFFSSLFYKMSCENLCRFELDCSVLVVPSHTSWQSHLSTLYSLKITVLIN